MVLTTGKAYSTKPTSDIESSIYQAVKSAIGVSDLPKVDYTTVNTPIGEYRLPVKTKWGSGVGMPWSYDDRILGVGRTISCVENWHSVSDHVTMSASSFSSLVSTLSAIFPGLVSRSYKVTFFSTSDEHKDSYSGDVSGSETVFLRHDHAGKVWTWNTSTIESIVNGFVNAI